MSFELLFLIASAAGFIGAMTGMGGGTLLIPAMTILGLDIKRAIAISVISVIATSSGSAAAYVRDHLTNLRAGMFLEIFTILGAMLGASITITLPQRSLHIIFGALMLVSWFIVRGKSKRDQKLSPEFEQDKFSQWLEFDGSYVDEATGKFMKYQGFRAYLGAPLMMVVGAIAGLFGIGAGAFKVLVLEMVMGLPTKVATTTSNLIIGVTALAGSSVYLAAGLIDPGLAAPVLLGVVAGAFVGTHLLVHTTDRNIQRFFHLILLFLGFVMILRGVRGF
jgi:uncharacterized membrane protein YfcA